MKVCWPPHIRVSLPGVLGGGTGNKWKCGQLGGMWWGPDPALVPDPNPIPRHPGAVLDCSD